MGTKNDDGSLNCKFSKDPPDIEVSVSGVL